MTIYCAQASCGMKNEYSGGIKPKFCQYCGQPFSKAFIPTSTASSPISKTISTQTAHENVENLSFDTDSIKTSTDQKLTVASLRESGTPVQRTAIDPELDAEKQRYLAKMIPPTPPAPAKRRGRKAAR